MVKLRPVLIGFSCMLAVMLLQESCVSHDFASFTCPEEEVSYAQDVHPIVMSKCAVSGCHGSDPNLPDWTDFGTFQEGAQSGNVRNYVLNRIMPPAESPAGPLSQDEINKIVCWANQGAPNN